MTLLRMVAVSTISTRNVRLPAAQVVLRADAREEAVDHADPRLARGHERAHLRQDHDVAGLPQVDGLPGHVRTGEDHDARVRRRARGRSA